MIGMPSREPMFYNAKAMRLIDGECNGVSSVFYTQRMLNLVFELYLWSNVK